MRHLVTKYKDFYSPSLSFYNFHFTTRYFLHALIYLIIFFLIYLYLKLFQFTIIDDAFITYNYAESLRNNFVWGFYDNNITNTATSPLNVILTGMSGLFFNNIINASIILASFEILITVHISITIVKKLYNLPMLGIVLPFLMIFNPLIISTLGLESILYCTVMVISVYFYLEKKMLMLGIALGLLSLTRLDGVILFLVILIFVLISSDNKVFSSIKYFSLKHLKIGELSNAYLKMSVGFILVVTPWIIFSWIFLGSFIPETLFIKIKQHWSDDYKFYNGIILYFTKYSVSSFFTILPLLGFFIFAITKKKSLEPLQKILITFPVVYFILYSFLNVPPYHWYYIPIIFSSILLFSLAFTKKIASELGTPNGLKKMIIVVVIILFSSIGIVNHLNKYDFTSPEEAPIHTNWASQQQYRFIANWINNHIDNTYPIHSQCEIGTLAYYSKEKLINVFSSRQLLTDKIIYNLQSKGGFFSILSNLNFLWYKNDEKKTKYNYLIKEYDYQYNNYDLAQIIKVWKISSQWVDSGVLLLFKNDVNYSVK